MRLRVLRLLALVVSAAMLALTGALGVAGTASAQPGQERKQNTVDVTGTDASGKTVFTGTFTATGPVKENPGNADRPLLVTGQLKGKLEGAGQQGRGQGPQAGQGQGTSPVNQQVEMPAAANFEPAMPSAAAGESVQPPACNVLNLTLGPLDLNLLGLRVQLNQVVLNITAIPGGGLLGDLLCGLAGGPAPPIPTVLQQIINLLNQILGALG